MFRINSDNGQIGSFWWVNADPRLVLVPGTDRKFCVLGACGVGGSPVIKLDFPEGITPEVEQFFQSVYQDYLEIEADA